MVDADILGAIIEKFISPIVNLSPYPVLDDVGGIRLPALDNHTMGVIFEELIRRFNEENNEEAGEQFTPRDVVELMADLIFLPIADKIKDSTYSCYDGACGTGGMLTVSQARLLALAGREGKTVSIHMFGQEINPETYAITRADLLLKGEGGSVENIAYGSTLADDRFPSRQFDFILSNPPYGKSWKNDADKLGGKKGIIDRRFVASFAGEGIITSAYVCLKSYENPTYLQYLLHSYDTQKYFYGLGGGVRQSIGFKDIRYIKIPLPPREEQNQIVRYLDWKVSLINKLINAKRRLIALLEEQRCETINTVVTHGISINTQMKDSGYSWLGEVPDTWHVRQFSKVAKICPNIVSPQSYYDLPQVSPANIEKNTGRLLPCGTVREAGIISGNHRFYKGQILYSKIRPLLNKVTIAPFDGLCSADMYHVETKLVTSYLVYFMLSNKFLSQLTMTGNRVKMPKINQDELSSIIILCPPEDEQQKIITYLDKHCASISTLINKFKEELVLFAEYRTRLISDVVTGKLDVRNMVVPDIDITDDCRGVACNALTRDGEDIGDSEDDIDRYTLY